MCDEHSSREIFMKTSKFLKEPPRTEAVLPSQSGFLSAGGPHLLCVLKKITLTIDNVAATWNKIQLCCHLGIGIDCKKTTVKVFKLKRHLS